ncbi:CLUMA_CG020090, isoform A [Clunio marinus]|uniref:glutathione transferase n=1 Tax=Clunio marinus TaxID=568069 RepID=A0A1J1J3S5_9DIPT|nr:CLUMA_CG020090, isoform A [Clunio marinus]
MDLYYENGSPPCLSVIVTAAALNVKLNLKELELEVNKEHLTPEFTKINPGTKTFTIADISIYSSFLTIPNPNNDFSPYPNIKKWLKLMEEKAPAKDYIKKSELELEVNKEHLTPEFTKINPQQTVPTLVDNGFALSESRAIMQYLVEKCGKDDSLYPKDLKTRAIVDQRLFFDIGTLYTHVLKSFFYWFDKKPEDPQDLKRLERALIVLNTFLEGNNYVAETKTFTIADISIYSSLLTIPNPNYDFSPYPNVKKWLKLMEEKAPAKDYIKKSVAAIQTFCEKYKP